MTVDDAVLTQVAPPGKRFGVAALLAAALSGTLLSGALVYFWRAPAPSEESAETKPVPSKYQCPMHPAVVQDHPGTCPICGMKLVPVEPKAVSALAAPSNGAPDPESSKVVGLGAVEIDPERQQLIGLKTAEVTREPIGGTWRSIGRVVVDETRVRHVNVKVSGFVERIFVDFVGKRVRRGDPLFSLYSPELLATQEELLLALRSGFSGANGDDALTSAARRKLALWDVPAAQLDELARTRRPQKNLVFHSPISGVVTKKDVVEGMKLDAGAMPYEIVDLSTVWALVDVYETDLRFVKEGLQAKLRLNALPNREFDGKVVFVAPLLDPQTRTIKVRLTFPNPTGELKPEMFGEAELIGESHEALTVPLDALIDSGKETIVFVASGEGKFEPRSVQVGVSDERRAEVVSGLAIGEQVVSRANFLIDSESKLRSSLDQTKATPPPESARVMPAKP